MLQPENQEPSGHNPAAWYALHTHHQHEKLVAQTLTSKGFEAFLPLHRGVRQWSDRSKILWLPLFPCYVFLRGGMTRRADVLATPGIHGFVTFGEKPAPIPEGEIEAVRRAIETRLSVEPHPFLRRGDWVRVKWGPLEGVEGILLRKKGVSRLVLSVALLERSIATEVDVSSVELLARQRLPVPPQALASPSPWRLSASLTGVFPAWEKAGAS